MTPTKPILSPCVCGDPLCVIPYRLCHCGCGQEVRLARQNSPLRGTIKGTPYRFISRHGGAFAARIYEAKLAPGCACACGDIECQIVFGLCHCGCGTKTMIASQTIPEQCVKGYPKRFLRGHQSLMRPVIEIAVPFKIEGVYCRLIPLTKGQYTIVDATDYEWLMQWKWCAQWNAATESFYAIRTISLGNGRQSTVRMNRQILGLDQSSSRKGDHKSGMTLDNRRANLRPANDTESSRNRGLRSDNKTGVTGVHKRGKRWGASIRVGSKTLWLGTFDQFGDAVSARKTAETIYFGEFVRPSANESVNFRS